MGDNDAICIDVRNSSELNLGLGILLRKRPTLKQDTRRGRGVRLPGKLGAGKPSLEGAYGSTTNNVANQSIPLRNGARVE